MIMALMLILLTLVLCHITMTVGLILDPTGKILPIGFKGNLSFDTHDLCSASHDFGGQVQAVPLAVYHPVSAEDIAALIKSVYESTDCGFTVSARGHGHSAQGQSLTSKGIVIKMNELANKPAVKARVNEKHKYVDVWGGELWIDLLKATLAYGLAPKSWTDYLYLSVGGTLSNAGISGQAYNYGPQISNVYELDVVTGKGELKTCSEEQNSELFHAVLGGLGQFGIITRARIALEPSPQRVRWIKVMYSNFSSFTQDQEYLISLHGQPQAADYVEGSVIVDPSRINNWRSSFSSSSTNPVNISSVAVANQSVLYSLEITKNYNQSHAKVDEDIEALLEKLSYIPETNSTTDISYVDFLDRVHKGELILRSQGLWDVPHPWLNLFVPKSRIEDFDKGVFKGILGNNTNGTVLVYPLNKSKWDNRSSAVTPDEDIFYLVAFLRSAFENQGESQMLEYLNNQNHQILSYCDENGIKIKQYLPHFAAKQEWIDHFGDKWSTFYRQKMDFDPKHILATGQGIFQPSDFAYYQGNI